MAITRSTLSPEAFLDAGRTLFQQKREHVRSSLARHKVYRSTYYELSMLTNRDLADLGIPRSGIRRLAKEAAYGE